MPANIDPKHDGQATDMSVEPQYAHRVASGPAAAAPQVGQFSEEGMVGIVQRTNRMRKGRAVERTCLCIGFEE
jgi:hypothetical protein